MTPPVTCKCAKFVDASASPVPHIGRPRVALTREHGIVADLSRQTQARVDGTRRAFVDTDRREALAPALDVDALQTVPDLVPAAADRDLIGLEIADASVRASRESSRSRSRDCARGCSDRPRRTDPAGRLVLVAARERHLGECLAHGVGVADLARHANVEPVDSRRLDGVARAPAVVVALETRFDSGIVVTERPQRGLDRLGRAPRPTLLTTP